MGRPGTRALGEAGYTRLEQLAGLREEELLRLHGVGPKALETIRVALAARGQSFVGDS